MDFIEILNLRSENKGVGTGVNWLSSKGELLHSYSPVDGKLIGSVSTTDKESYDKTIETAQEAFVHWRMMPAPARGEIVRQIGEALREYKEPLGNWFLMKWEKVCRRVTVRSRK
jgi:aldehyde dehydrogenase (NAD+)